MLGGGEGDGHVVLLSVEFLFGELAEHSGGREGFVADGVVGDLSTVATLAVLFAFGGGGFALGLAGFTAGLAGEGAVGEFALDFFEFLGGLVVLVELIGEKAAAGEGDFGGRGRAWGIASWSWE